MADHAPIYLTSTAWTTAPAVAESVMWQVRSGTVLLTTGDVASAEASLLLSAPQAVVISSGFQVHARSLLGTPAHVSRNVV